ncbi:MAG: CIA30 family protein [Aequorivita sp.]
MLNNNKLKIDFRKGLGGQDWMIVNDTVMGGYSCSEMTIIKNSLVFKGELSLKNNGGFASIRSSNQKFDLSKYTSVKIRFRSSGRDFSLRLASSDLYYKPNYKNGFTSSTGEWEIVSLKMSDFKEYTMGKISSLNVSKNKLESIIRIGIIISDNKEGPFDVEMDYIEFE